MQIKAAIGKQSEKWDQLFAALFISCTLGAAAWFFLSLGLVSTIEFKALDFFQRFRLTQSGPQVAPELVLVGIDDQSNDPSYSINADVPGRGGWLTREHWSLPLQFFRNFYHPSVVSYDYLLRPMRERGSDPAAQQLLQQLHGPEILQKRNALFEIEAEGNLEIQKQLFDLSDARDAGLPSPQIIFAIEFPEDQSTSDRLDVAEQRTFFDLLEPHLLPEGCIREPNTLSASRSVRLPVREMVEAPIDLATINTPRDPDGVIRHVPLIWACSHPDAPDKKLYMPSFALRTLLNYWGVNLADLKPPGKGVPSLGVEAGGYLLLDTGLVKRRVPVDSKMRLLLNPRFLIKDLASCSYVDLSDYGLRLGAGAERAREEGAEALAEFGKAVDLQKRLQGKILVVADTATGGSDLGNFALQNNLPNAMAHLTVMDNILREDYLQPTSPHDIAWLVGGITLYSFIICSLLNAKGASMGLLGLALLYPFAFAIAVTQFAIAPPLVTPVALLGGLFAFNAFYHYQHEATQRKQVRQMFSAMVSPRVLELMEASPDALNLKGVRTEATMFFSDLGGFTTFAEKADPEELAAMLNQYLTPMSEIIVNEDGYVDKYAGDGIMAVWGVPFPLADHAVKACRAALAQLKSLDRLNRTIFSLKGAPLRVRMGINTGEVSAGNMGSVRKIQYTVMGDAVNLAARLEPTNKDYGTQILLGERTYELAKDHIRARMLDKIVVKGKTVPIIIYDLLSMRDEKSDEEFDWVKAYETGLRRLWAREWDEAKACFRRTIQLHGSDEPARLMLSRAEEFALNPPGPEWQGEYVRLRKD